MAATPLDIADDEARLTAIVDAMAVALEQGLSLKNPAMMRADFNLVREVGASRMEEVRAPTLGQLLYTEGRYPATVNQLDFLDDLRESYTKALRADKLARTLLRACGYGADSDDERDEQDDDAEGASEFNPSPEETGAVAIAPYVSWWGYYSYNRPLIHDCPELVTGGVGRMLRDCVHQHAFEWLFACDKTLCTVHDEEYTAPADEFVAFVDTIALDIAKRVTMHHKPSSLGSIVPMEVDHLDPRYLESRADVEFTRTRVEAQCQKVNDMHALQALQAIALDGGNTVEAMNVLTARLPFLRIVITTPPTELGLVGENARRMNLPMLARVLDTTMLPEVRSRIATHWQGCHGAVTYTATTEAIARLRGFDPKQTNRFIAVGTQQRARGNVMLPQMPFAPWSKPWFATPAPLGPYTRTGLDSVGRRLVRLGSLVWQLTGEGVFEKGVVHRHVLAPVAMEALQTARLARERIDHERRKSNLGIRLHNFNEQIQDGSSDVAPELDKMMCALSNFSLYDILQAFHPDLPLVERIARPLTQRTRARLGNCRTPVIPVEYDHFAIDALSSLMPAIRNRRLAFSHDIRKAPHPLGDLLRTVPKLRTWTPLEGRFRLDVPTLRNSHPKLREALEYYSAQSGAFVSAPHLVQSASGRARHVPVSFVFESSALLQLLRM